MLKAYRHETYLLIFLINTLYNITHINIIGFSFKGLETFRYKVLIKV